MICVCSPCVLKRSGTGRAGDFLGRGRKGRGRAFAPAPARRRPQGEVRLDPDRLIQALLNLLVNAVQATEPGGSIEVALESGRAQAVDGAFWSISISDTGCGMSAQTVAQLFTPYFTTKASGTGLGLVLTQQIVERHGGRDQGVQPARQGLDVHHSAAPGYAGRR